MSKEITLKSGRVIKWRKCPRYILWGHGKTVHTFQKRAQEAQEGGIEDPVERGLSMFEQMSDFERIKLQKLGDDIVKNTTDVRDPDDLTEAEFWEVFGLTMYSTPDAPIETEDGETTVEAVETFPVESVIQTAGEDVSDVSSESVEEDGHLEPVGV